MKKVLSTVAVLGLVAGLATSAAALELKVKGDYTVDGFYIDDSNGAPALPGTEAGGGGVALTGTKAKSDAWLQHMFNIEAEMVVNDKISMMSRVRLIDWGTVWGSQDDTNVNNGRNMSIERLWMVYKSDIGLWDVGRRPGAAFGLSFIDSVGNFDRIMWRSGKLFGDTFSAHAYFQKNTEAEAYLADTDDQDTDYYEVAGAAKGGWGSATLAYGLTLNNSGDIPGTTEAGFETNQHRIKGVGQFKIGSNMGLDTEFDYNWGEKDYNQTGKTDQDISKFAFIADFWATVDALTGHAMYFHTSGDDDNAITTDIEDYGGTGADFEPLYILTGAFGRILNSDQGGSDAQTAGVHAVVVSADYAATQDLSLRAAIGYAQADKEKTSWDDEYGFEYNVGAAYRLQDNLIYAVHLGYLDTGDFFKKGIAATELNNIMLASHHLTMSF
jgi:hypothetical protein